MRKRYRSVSELQGETGLGRDLILRICNQMPHCYVGRGRLIVDVLDWEWILHSAAQERCNLWEVVNTEGKIAAWVAARTQDGIRSE